MKEPRRALLGLRLLGGVDEFKVACFVHWLRDFGAKALPILRRGESVLGHSIGLSRQINSFSRRVRRAPVLCREFRLPLPCAGSRRVIGTRPGLPFAQAGRVTTSAEAVHGALHENDVPTRICAGSCASGAC